MRKLNCGEKNCQEKLAGQKKRKSSIIMEQFIRQVIHIQ